MLSQFWLKFHDLLHDQIGMVRCLNLVLLLMALGGCTDKMVRMESPEDPEGAYRAQIAVAKRLLQQSRYWLRRCRRRAKEA
jgi:hypothetical protein